MTVQMQMFYLFQVVKKQLIEPRNAKKNIAVSTTKKRCKNRSLQVLRKNSFRQLTKSLKDVQKQKTMFSEFSSY